METRVLWDQAYGVPTNPAPQEETEIWLCHFREYRRMGPGGMVAASGRSPAHNLSPRVLD